MGTAHQPSPATSRIRELSRQLVLSELRSSQGLSRSQLAARTGLSRGTVSAVVTELMQQGRCHVTGTCCMAVAGQLEPCRWHRQGSTLGQSISVTRTSASRSPISKGAS